MNGKLLKALSSVSRFLFIFIIWGNAVGRFLISHLCSRAKGSVFLSLNCYTMYRLIFKYKFMLTKEFIEEMRAKLLAEKELLATDSAGLAEHTELGREFDENAQEVELDDVNADMRNRMKGDLEKIEKALAKIDAGTYGTDDEGREISEERLRVIPWADEAI